MIPRNCRLFRIMRRRNDWRTMIASTRSDHRLGVPLNHHRAVASRPGDADLTGLGDRDAGGGILVQLVTQCPDGDAEDPGGLGPVPEAVVERVEDKRAL